MSAQVRIVGGELRGRKLVCKITAELRPTPDMVREALFNILGNAVPGRMFVDIFSGTGVVAMEALSRGAAQAYLVERDNRLATDIERNLKSLHIDDKVRLFRTDAYRWVSHWQAPAEPVNVFISPPFVDLHEQPELLVKMVEDLQHKLAVESVVVLQAEKHSPLDDVSMFATWEKRRYSRNELFIWQKEEAAPASAINDSNVSE